MDAIADALSDYAANLRFEDLSERAIHSAKRSIVDSFGCAFGSFDGDVARILRTIASQVSSQSPASVIGTKLKTSPDLAAFVNGGMVRYLDFSDDFFAGTGDIGPHPSDNICGVMAACESMRRNGKDLILGVILAYEACGQLTEAIDLRRRKPTWDYPILHAISSALGAARMFGLTQAQIRHALALAAVPNVCLNQTRTGELSHWKGLAGPNASRNGIFAAILARAGATGPDEPFEGKGGLIEHLSMPLSIGRFGSKAEPFKVERTFYKSIPVRYSAQLPIYVAMELRTRTQIEAIHSIRVFVPRRYATSRDLSPEQWNPMTRETADHSFPYLISSALKYGEIGAATFEPHRIHDAGTRQLMEKIEIFPEESFSDQFPQTFNCRFDVTLNSGELLSIHQKNPKGHPDNPMTDAEIEEKFFMQSPLDRTKGQALLDTIWSLEHLDSCEELLGRTLLPSG